MGEKPLWGTACSPRACKIQNLVKSNPKSTTADTNPIDKYKSRVWASREGCFELLCQAWGEDGIDITCSRLGGLPGGDQTVQII